MTTPRIAAAIEAEEGRKLKAYPDPLSPLGKACAKARIALSDYRSLPTWHVLDGAPWTIGVGQTGAGIGPDTEWTNAEADAALAASIAKATAGLDKALPWWKSLCDVRQDVVAQMAYQMGLEGLLAFHRTLGFMQDHQYDQAAEGMLQSLWARQTPNRAHRLAELMRTGEYPA